MDLKQEEAVVETMIPNPVPEGWKESMGLFAHLGKELFISAGWFNWPDKSMEIVCNCENARFIKTEFNGEEMILVSEWWIRKFDENTIDVCNMWRDMVRDRLATKDNDHN